jgi:hypothetical protein
MFTRWLKFIASQRKARTLSDYTWLVDDVLKPEFGKHRPADVTRGEARRLHARLTASRGPVTSNRALQTLRAAYNWAAKQDDDTLPANFVNPVKGCDFNRENVRIASRNVVTGCLTSDVTSAAFAPLRSIVPIMPRAGCLK